jgi:hypothetical protein
MPERSGPWALDKVKRRLRQEQVAREQAASARYRLLEQPPNLQENSTLSERYIHQEQPAYIRERTILVDSNAGRRSCSDCLLVVLVLFCFFLTLVALALSGVVFSLLQKENER